MRHLVFVVVMFFGTFPLLANSEKAIAAFLADSSVRQALDQIPEAYKMDEQIQSMTIKTFCGWAGCFDTELVSARVVPIADHINARSWSIVAKVVVHAGNIQPVVELLPQDFFDNRSHTPTNGCFR